MPKSARPLDGGKVYEHLTTAHDDPLAAFPEINNLPTTNHSKKQIVGFARQVLVILLEKTDANVFGTGSQLAEVRSRIFPLIESSTGLADNWNEIVSGTDKIAEMIRGFNVESDAPQPFVLKPHNDKK